MVLIPPELLAAAEHGYGAHFRKAALQVNPWAYVVAHGKPTEFATEADYNDALVEALLAEGVEVIGITDHNRASSAASLVAAAAEAGIVALPGAELASREGVHVLCLFDHALSVEQVDERVMRLDIGDNGLSALGVTDMIRKVNQLGGVCVAPHVTSDGGLLKILSGESRRAAWLDEGLTAVAINKTLPDESNAFVPMLTGSEPAYSRAHMPAIINANDIWAPAQVGRDGSWTWLKMSEVALGGVRHAFIDPDSRVRRFDDPPSAEAGRITALHWSGGFFDSMTMSFQTGVNVLIGGRGAGKSGVIRSIRHLLNAQPLTDAVSSDHNRFAEKVLRDCVIWGAVHSRLHQSSYVLRRVPGSQTEVFDLDGNLLSINVADLRLGIEIYGQHELAEVAHDPRQQVALVRRYLPAEDPTDAVTACSQQAAQQRARIHELEESIAANATRLQQLPGKKALLARFKEQGLEERIGRKAVIGREGRIFAKPRDLALRADSAADALVAGLRPLPKIDSEALNMSSTGGPLLDLPAAIALLLSRAEKAAADVREAAGDLRKSTDDAEAAWQRATSEELSALAAALQELGDERRDGQAFLQLDAEVDALDALATETAGLRSELARLLTERGALLNTLLKAKTDGDKAYRSAAGSAMATISGYVRVRIVQGGDSTQLQAVFDQYVGGRFAETRQLLDAKAAASELDVSDLAAACREGVPALQDRYGITAAQATTLCEGGERLWRSLEEVDLLPVLTVELNLGSPAQQVWRALADLSTGQKATALLLLALAMSDGAGPLVIDQPEDDLDSDFIVQGVVTRLRAAKSERQFILASHNPNVPVLADAEVVVSLRAEGEADAVDGRAIADSIGSIDRPATRLAVEQLEGGKLAFETRRRKYGY